MPSGPKAYEINKQLEMELGPDRVRELKLRLTQGESVKTLVPVVQETWGLFPNKKPSTVSTILYRYNRDTVKKEAAARVLATVEKAGHLKVSSLLDMADLCEKQKQRVTKALDLEDKMSGLLTDQASDQIRLLSDMLGKLAYLQLETGLLQRAPKTVKGVMLGADGQATTFGWVESDDDLLNRLTIESQVVRDDERSDEPGFTE